MDRFSNYSSVFTNFSKIGCISSLKYAYLCNNKVLGHSQVSGKSEVKTLIMMRRSYRSDFSRVYPQYDSEAVLQLSFGFFVNFSVMADISGLKQAHSGMN